MRMPKLRILFFLTTFLFAISSSFAQIDLELSMTQSVDQADQWSAYSIDVVIKNSGSDNASGIIVTLPEPDGAVYVGGNEITISQGDINVLNRGRWDIGSLASGAEATATVNFFQLAEQTPIAYFQVIRANEDDIDSTPNNGTPPIVNEDDEATSQPVVNGDIGLVVGDCQDNGTPFPEDDFFSFTIFPETIDLGGSYSVWSTNSGGSYLRSDILENFLMVSRDFLISEGDVDIIVRDADGVTVGTATAIAPNACPNQSSPELKISFVNTDPTFTVFQNSNLGLPLISENFGTGDPVSYNIGFYLSEDAVISNDDFKFASFTYGPIAAGATENLFPSLGINNQIDQGNYFLILKTDDNDGFVENNEADNIILKPIQVFQQGDEIDLELTMNQSVDQADQWSNYSVDLLVKNTGPETATGVVVNFAKPDGVVYVGGNQFQVSQGSFIPFGAQNWNVGTIAPDAEATITVNYFQTVANTPLAYAQVVAANEDDVDSTPNNGTPPTPNEDDEASSATNTASQLTFNCPDDETYTGIQGFGICQGFNLLVPPIAVSTCPNANVTVAFEGFTLIDGYISVEDFGPGGMCGGIHITGDGTATVNFSATDECGNVTNCSYDVTRNILINTITFLDCPDVVQVMAEQGENGAIVDYDYPTVVRYCSGIRDTFQISEAFLNNSDYAPGSFLPIGDYTVNMAAYCGGLQNDCTFQIEVLPYSPSTDCSTNLGDGVISCVNSFNDGSVSLLMKNGSSITAVDIDADGEITGTNAAPSIPDEFAVTVVNNKVEKRNYTQGTIIYEKDIPQTLLSDYAYFSGATEFNNGFVLFAYKNFNASTTSYDALWAIKTDENLQPLLEKEIGPGGAASFVYARNGLQISDSEIAFERVQSGSGNFSTSLVVIDDQLNVLSDNVYGSGYSAGLKIKELPCGNFELTVNTALYFCIHGSCYNITTLQGIFVNGEFIRYRSETLSEVSTLGIGNRTSSWFMKTDDGITATAIKQQPVPFNPGEEAPIFITKKIDGTVAEEFTLFTSANQGQLVQIGPQLHFVAYINGTAELIDLSCADQPIDDEVDLELTMSSTNPSPSIWSEYTVNLTVSNKGTESASGIVVDIPLPDGVVYKGGTEFSSTQGILNVYTDHQWNVGILAGNSEATISINYFLRSNGSVSHYAQVLAQNELEEDSAPGNGTCCQAVEDDEAAFEFNQSSQKTAQSKEGVFLAYPNPVDDFLTVDLQLLPTATGIYLYNSMGHLMLEKNLDSNQAEAKVMLNTSDFTNGTYYLRVAGNGFKARGEVIIIQRGY